MDRSRAPGSPPTVHAAVRRVAAHFAAAHPSHGASESRRIRVTAHVRRQSRCIRLGPRVSREGGALPEGKTDSDHRVTVGTRLTDSDDLGRPTRMGESDRAWAGARTTRMAGCPLPRLRIHQGCGPGGGGRGVQAKVAVDGRRGRPAGWPGRPTRIGRLGGDGRGAGGLWSPVAAAAGVESRPVRAGPKSPFCPLGSHLTI